MRRSWFAAALAGSTVLGALATALFLSGHDTRAPLRSGPALTTPVLRQDLVDSVTVPGEVTHGAATPITSRAAGTVTWLPAVAATIGRGGVLFKADERPVVLLLGLVPMYRSLSSGATGPDVKQLEGNLRALGYGGFIVDDRFGAATVTAVRQWQRDLGVPVSGVVDVADVIYSPTAVRVDAALVRLGAPATGDVLSVTGTTKQVRVTAQSGTAGWATPGTAVTVTGSGASADGRVEFVQADTAASTVVVTVSVRDQAVLMGSTVDVQYVARRRDGVLTVPVAALLALDSGGYGVELADGRIVAVEVGMFAAGRVEVNGPEIREGTTVGIPR